MRICVLAAVAAAAVVAVPAFAQDTGPFDGARVEGIIGHDSVDVLGEANKGVLYGLGLGYDFRAGGAVVGIEGEYTDSSADECAALTGRTFCSDAGRDLYIGLRAGAQVSSNILLYAKAGYTNARLETVSIPNGVVGADVERKFDLNGFRLGAGGEIAITRGAYLKTEYRYSRYGQNDEFVGGDAVNPILLPGDRTKHQVVAGIGVRF